MSASQKKGEYREGQKHVKDFRLAIPFVNRYKARFPRDTEHGPSGRGESEMSKFCDFCGKGPQVGHNVSHANNKTKRRFLPNLQTMRTVLPSGEVRRVSVCTRCVRSGAVVRPTMK